MSFTIIREERITHTGNGLQLEDDLFIKLDTAFDELVAELGRGGELPALIHIQLREAYASSGRGNPATLKTIALAASCKERQAQRIVKSLLGKSLIAEAGMSPHTGEKFYRPLGYAWFGSNRESHKRPVSLPVSGVSSVTPLNMNSEGRGVKCHPPVLVVDDVDPSQAKSSIEQQQTTASRKILAEIGIFGKPLDRLSSNVEPKTARAWQAWLERAPAYLRNPVGIIVNALLADPDAQPPMPKTKTEPRKPRPVVYGKIANERAQRDKTENP